METPKGQRMRNVRVKSHHQVVVETHTSNCARQIMALMEAGDPVENPEIQITTLLPCGHSLMCNRPSSQ